MSGQGRAAVPAAAGRIAELPPAVADAIAAGEVIERPASAVKELLDNACDAGARRIEVEIEGAGLGRILVRDDGAGMTPEELPLAFRRHATSKLRTLDDLTALRSYGFRGEALPSLAAVAEVECTTRPPGAALGARLRLGGGAPGAVEMVGAPLGTTIDLRDIFARQPARRRFLPGARSERAAVARVCGDASLARPEIALRLRIEGRETLVTPGLDGESGDGPALSEARRAALAAIWDAETAAAALHFAAERPIEAGGALRAEGLAAPPSRHRGRRDGLRLFVNGRPVLSAALAQAVEGAYAELLPRGRHPIAAVFLEAPPERVDANVHPAKATVKLADERALFSLLQRALREVLLGRPALGGLPPAAGTGADGVSIPAPPDFLRRGAAAPAPAPWAPRDDRWTRLRRLRELGNEAAPSPGAPLLAAPPPAPLAPGPARAPLAAGEGTLPGLPLLRLVGQLRATFIVAEGPEGMLLVDQHAAHERVVYERLLARRGAGTAERQALLEPVLVELDAARAAALAGHEQELRALGFELEPFGGRALRVRALPAALLSGGPLSGGGGGGRVRAALESILGELADPDGAGRGGADPVAASAACHGSVRAGTALAASEMAALLRDLEGCRNPHTCPHGRPTFVGFPADDLERQFGRR